jgi:hypothetical protein
MRDGLKDEKRTNVRVYECTGPISDDPKGTRVRSAEWEWRWEMEGGRRTWR